MEDRQINGVSSLTLNPCFDLTLTLSRLDEDDVNRTEHELLESAGKGMNVSCVLSRLGVRGTAFILAGEDNLAQYQERLPKGDFETRFIPVPGRIRENITVCPPGRCLKINREGFTCTRGAVESLLAALDVHLRPGLLLAISGSWPRGFGREDFFQITRLAAGKGALLSLDTDRLGLSELRQIRPWIVKPNEHELSVLTGMPADTPVQVAEALSALHRCGIPFVLLSLGSRGLILSARGRRLRARIPRVDAPSSVGAGDSCLAGFLAGYLSGQPGRPGRPLEECARQAAACGTATAMQPGTGLATPEGCAALMPQIQVEEI